DVTTHKVNQDINICVSYSLLINNLFYIFVGNMFIIIFILYSYITLRGLFM
ncbi:hypothetical protein L9F63_019519, partial [Diploptera punctata]